MTNKKTIAILVFLGLLGFVSPQGKYALAAATVTTPATAAVSSDSAASSGSSVALPSLVLTEGATGDIPVGALTWALPAGYVFDTASAASVAYTGTGLAGSSTTTFPNNTHFSVAITSTSTAAGSVTIGSTAAPLKVKATTGTPMAAAGNITLSAGTVPGVSTTTNFGTLTQAPGAANKLAFTTQPPATAAVGVTFPNSIVAVEDQFSNVLTSDNGRVISLTVVAVNPTSTTGVLGGTTTLNDNAGTATFNSLSFSQPGTIKLQANSASLSGGASNDIVVSAATGTTTPTTTPGSITRILPNGILVKLASSSTIYMVVNNTLRPFTTPAIFHAKGKKFQNIVIITQDIFNRFAIGKPVGHGSDDDDTVVTPPLVTSSSTAPSLANLPEGTLVKVPGNPTIYIVSGGVLKPFTSMLVLLSHKKDLKKIKSINLSELSFLPIGSPATFADGTLVKGSGPTVYVIRGGAKYGIPSMLVLSKKGLSLRNLLKVKDSDLDNASSGGVED